MGYAISGSAAAEGVARLAEEPLLVREEGSATRQVTERTLERAGVRWRVGMELNHTEAIKQAVMPVSVSPSSRSMRFVARWPVAA